MLLGREHIKVKGYLNFNNNNENVQTIEINLYINTGISNLHIWSIDSTKMRYLPLYQLDTQLRTSKPPKIFSTYLVERNGDMWKTWFSASQNAKNEHQMEHKNQVHNRRYLESWALECEILYSILCVEHIKVNGSSNFNKFMRK